MLKAGKQKLLLNLRDDAVVSGGLGVLVKKLMQRRRGGSDGQAKPQEQHETGRKPANHSSPPSLFVSPYYSENLSGFIRLLQYKQWQRPVLRTVVRLTPSA